VIVISNRGAIGRGLITRETVDEITRRMVAEIRSAGGRVDDVFYCPQHPHDGCTCRKARPGLLLQAADRWNLDLSRSVLIGDVESDMVAAERAGCRPLLVLTGRGQDQLAALHAAGRNGFEVATDLPAAVGRICSEMQHAATDPQSPPGGAQVRSPARQGPRKRGPFHLGVFKISYRPVKRSILSGAGVGGPGAVEGCGAVFSQRRALRLRSAD
jgi:HAD superfamily hydrolase (TIGR01662 family)